MFPIHFKSSESASVLSFREADLQTYVVSLKKEVVK